MVRLTYVVETPTAASPAVQPVNLAFAAAAAARASWASKEREDYHWDFEPLTDGLAPGAALGGISDGNYEGSFLLGGIRGADADLQAAVPRISGAGLVGVDGPNIHDIPRNSVLFRTHAAQQTMTSSLPPTEPNPPSAIEVAAVMEERKSRGLLNLPDDALPPRGLLRSASFAATSLEPGAARESLRTAADSGPGSAIGANGDSTAPYGKSTFAGPYIVGVSGAARGALSSSGAHPADSAGADGRSGGADLDADTGDGERDGCLVLPVLRTLLAMQQDEGGGVAAAAAAKHAPTRAAGVGGSLTQNGGNGYNHSHGYGHSHTGHLNGMIHSYPNGSFSRQASILRASTCSPGTANGGVGGALSRQTTMTAANASSPARRRVAAVATAAAAAGELASLAAARQAAPRRQVSIRPTASYPMSHFAAAVAAGSVGGAGTMSMDDDDPFGFGALEPAGRAVSYSVPAGPSSPMSHVSYHASSRYQTRTTTNLGLVQPPPVDAGGGGGGSGISAHVTAISGGSGRNLSPPPAGRNGRVTTAKQQHQQQLQHAQQPQPPPQQPPPQQLVPQPPQQPPPQPAPGKTKSGRALFAWTNKLSKGKWPLWFPGGGGGGGAAGAPGGGNGGGRISQELSISGAAVHGTAYGPGLGSGSGDAAFAAAAAAAAAAVIGTQLPPAATLRSSLSGNGRSVSNNGRASSNGRVSINGRPGNADASGGGAGSPQGPLSPVMSSREAVQLPPIEHRRRSTAAANASIGGGAGGGPGVASLLGLGSTSGVDPGSPRAGMRGGFK